MSNTREVVQNELSEESFQSDLTPEIKEKEKPLKPLEREKRFQINYPNFYKTANAEIKVTHCNVTQKIEALIHEIEKYISLMEFGQSSNLPHPYGVDAFMFYEKPANRTESIKIKKGPHHPAMKIMLESCISALKNRDSHELDQVKRDYRGKYDLIHSSLFGDYSINNLKLRLIKKLLTTISKDQPGWHVNQLLLTTEALLKDSSTTQNQTLKIKPYGR